MAHGGFVIISVFYLFEIVHTKKIKNAINGCGESSTLAFFLMYKDLAVILPYFMPKFLSGYERLLTEHLCFLRKAVEFHSTLRTDTSAT